MKKIALTLLLLLTSSYSFAEIGPTLTFGGFFSSVKISVDKLESELSITFDEEMRVLGESTSMISLASGILDQRFPEKLIEVERLEFGRTTTLKIRVDKSDNVVFVTNTEPIRNHRHYSVSFSLSSVKQD